MNHRFYCYSVFQKMIFAYLFICVINFLSFPFIIFILFVVCFIFRSLLHVPFPMEFILFFKQTLFCRIRIVCHVTYSVYHLKATWPEVWTKKSNTFLKVIVKDRTVEIFQNCNCDFTKKSGK